MDVLRRILPDRGLSIKDDSLGIDWKIPTENALLSEKEDLRFMVKGS